jgi:cell division protease FtsH
MKVKAVSKRPAWTGSSQRIPSSQPPVAIPKRIVEEKETKKETEKKPRRVKKSASD